MRAVRKRRVGNIEECAAAPKTRAKGRNDEREELTLVFRASGAAFVRTSVYIIKLLRRNTVINMYVVEGYLRPPDEWDTTA